MHLSVCVFVLVIHPQINEIFAEKKQQSTITSRLFRHGYKRFSEFVHLPPFVIHPIPPCVAAFSHHFIHPRQKVVFVRCLMLRSPLHSYATQQKVFQAIFIMIYFCFYSIFVISLCVCSNFMLCCVVINVFQMATR